jgi:isopentenyl diphosphate isomerase/L-lactate dehydrogenase-like FMN-dependent dehydrogenase
MLPINIKEYELLAHNILEPMAWDYFSGGSDDEITLQANCSAYTQIQLHPRILVDSDQCDLATTMLGIPLCMPLGITAMGCQGLAHPDGECATVRAAGALETLTLVSCMSNYRLEDIAQASSGPLWFQLYIFRDRRVTEQLIYRVENAGYCALVITIDTPRLGRRERDIRNGFGLPPTLYLANFADSNGREIVRPQSGSSELASHAQTHFDARLTWDVFDWLHSVTSLPLVVKGILSAEDAVLAVEHGVAGIIVSNHGGRQLDTVPASIEVLSEIVEAIGGRCEVFLDGGIRRGTDILKALALGAQGVFVGRPILWGLAVNGEQGVYHVLELLRAELELAMALVGCPTVAHIDHTIIKRRMS